MKIALLGYGKMGHIIEQIAIERGHEITLKKNSKNSFKNIETADVAIDFSLPESAVLNIKTCIDNQIPVVSGTTGWLEKYDQIVEYCNIKNGTLIYSPNFSLGVNIFFELNNHLAEIMSQFKEYHVSLEEIHHTQKLDAPSGTAISLANDIIEKTHYESWSLEKVEENQIPITAIRQENVPGTHSIFYESATDQIEIKHTAYTREGFALGAVIAAEWIFDKKGVFSMKDILNFKK